MSQPNYKFELIIDAVSTEVAPVGDIKLTKEPADDDLFRFYLRSKLSNVRLIGSDYGLVRDVRIGDDPCQEMILRVTSQCGSDVNFTEDFSFSIYDCEWNDDVCTVDITADVEDKYKCLKRSWEDEVNFFDFATKIDTRYRLLSAHSSQFTWFNGVGNVAGPDRGGPEDTGITYDIEVQFNPFPTFDVDNPNQGWSTSRRVTVPTGIGNYYLWIRFTSTVECVDGGLPDWLTTTQSVPFEYDYTAVGCYNIIRDDCDESGTITIAWDHPYIADPGGPAEDTSDFPTAAGLGFNASLVDVVTANNLPPGSDRWYLGKDLVFDYWFWLRPDINAAYYTDYNLYNSVPLDEVLVAQVPAACDEISSVVSNFLQINPTNPSTDNYVTGEFNIYDGQYILLSQITDVVSPSSNTYQQATRMNGNLKDLLETINRTMRLFPTFVGDNLVLEHESTYLDSLAVIIDISDDENRNDYSFDIADVWAKMTYKWKTANGVEFKGLPMEYGPLCTNREKTEIKTNNYTSDIQHIVGNDDFDSDESGVVLTQCYISDDNYLWAEAGFITGAIKPNHGLSWSALHHRFHRHNRPLLVGQMNGQEVTHESSARIKEQEIPFKICCGLEITSGLVRTELGDGLINSAEINLRNNQVKFVLKHEQ